MSSLTIAARAVSLSNPGVSQLSSLRRSTILYSQAESADSLYLIESGLVKLTRTNSRNGRLILAVCGAGHVVGEEVLSDNMPLYYSHAEVIMPADLVRVPKQAASQLMSDSPEFAMAITAGIIEQKRLFAEKMELLCLHDVEYRILHYLGRLAQLVAAADDGSGHHLPITQLELADLIGATRETTSTTLNQLERKGLVKLSRRLMTVPAPEALLQAAAARHEAPTDSRNSNSTVSATAGV